MTDEALIELEKAVNLDPEDPEIRYHLGEVYLKKGMKNKARGELKKALELKPRQDLRDKIMKSIGKR